MTSLRIFHIALCILCLLLGAGVSGKVQAEDFAQFELELLSLINQARENPIEMAATLGMDPDQILREHPELAYLLVHGLFPLKLNERLNAAATAHTGAMLAEGFYGSVSLDGRTASDRIKDAGYQPGLVGESLGMLGFANFIEPGEAVRLMFETIFKDELSPDRTEQRNILNPEFTEIGISLRSGVFNFEGIPWNVYLLTCDFGTDFNALSVDAGLIRMINDARKDPLQAVRDNNIDEEIATQNLGDVAWILQQRLPPLATARRLRIAAIRHNQDMLQRLYFDTISPDGETPADRALNAGYEAQLVGERLAFMVTEKGADPMAVAQGLFKKLIEDELEHGATQQLSLFSVDFTQIAIGYSATDFDMDTGGTFHLLVADFATPSVETVYLIGSVFEDQNGDENFDYGEAIPELTVSLQPIYGAENGNKTHFSRTNILGQYQLPIEPFSFYALNVADDDENILYSRIVVGQDQNVFQDLGIEPNKAENLAF